MIIRISCDGRSQRMAVSKEFFITIYLRFWFTEVA